MQPDVQEQPLPTAPPHPYPRHARPGAGRLGWLIPLLVAGAVLAVLAVAAVTVLVLVLRTQSPPPPVQLTVSGTMLVRKSCFAIEVLDSTGYGDVPGSQVRITDGAGNLLGIGDLPRSGTPSGGACAYPWSVSGVDPGHEFYSVEVGRRGKLSYPRADLDRPVSTSLGS
ncbi:hypothetical protein GCM10010124_22610 [Pilimelia terevasa]|uniref:Uncharacterized protein n=1 Tax=Pilimelia terevasa TaxID=53372 RepID=A0A8J3BM90_9ACTN|nr:hypothetical protein [Pilimelia terevasa]GGK29307.1 hypothetical protein GCM10010124_22610 [Pilimelia terevasa]